MASRSIQYVYKFKHKSTHAGYFLPNKDYFVLDFQKTFRNIQSYSVSKSNVLLCVFSFLSLITMVQTCIMF